MSVNKDISRLISKVSTPGAFLGKGGGYCPCVADNHTHNNTYFFLHKGRAFDLDNAILLETSSSMTEKLIDKDKEFEAKVTYLLHTQLSRCKDSPALYNCFSANDNDEGGTVTIHTKCDVS